MNDENLESSVLLPEGSQDVPSDEMSDNEDTASGFDKQSANPGNDTGGADGAENSSQEPENQEGDTDIQSEGTEEAGDRETNTGEKDAVNEVDGDDAYSGQNETGILESEPTHQTDVLDSPAPGKPVVVIESPSSSPDSHKIDTNGGSSINGVLLFLLIAAALSVIAAVATVLIGTAMKKRRRRNQEEVEVVYADTASERSFVTVEKKKKLCVTVGNAQNIGARKDQQDSFGISDVGDTMTVDEKGVFAVLADGLGGMNDGGIVSRTAVQAALRAFSRECAEADSGNMLLKILKAAKDAVLNSGVKDGGTTFMGVIIRNGGLNFISIGDSRVYLLRSGGLIQLNREHVFGRELDDLWTNGALEKEKTYGDRRRKALTSYLGKNGDLQIDRNITPIPLFSGDRIVLMSDGIFGFISEKEMEEALIGEPMVAANALCSKVISKRDPHQDNMTAVVLGIREEIV